MAITPADATATAAYLFAVNPRQTIPGANIRQIRGTFVNDLEQNIRETGWRSTSYPTVYEPVDGVQVRNMPSTEVAGLTFQIMDGAHRLAALRRLQNDISVPEFGADYVVEVKVIPTTRHVAQRAADAAAQNSVEGLQAARRTFCDELWTMIGIQADLVQRVVKFSTSLADPSPSSGADAGPRSRPRDPVDFDTLQNVPAETGSFISSYKKSLYKKLVNPARKSRSFNLSEDFPLLSAPVVVSMLQDSVSGVNIRDNPVGMNEYTKVKWRILRHLLPFYAELRPITDVNQDSVGGSGIVRVPGKDTRLWDFMCLVNNRAKFDQLSYHRIYNPFFQNAYIKTLCGLLLLSKLAASSTGQPAQSAPGRGRTRSRSELTQNALGTRGAGLCEIVCSIYAQYSGAAAVLPNVPDLEALVGPVLSIDRATLCLSVIPDKMKWVDPKELFILEEEAQTVSKHPSNGLSYDALGSKERALDSECRALATKLIEDVQRASVDTKEDCTSRFGSFLQTDSVADVIHPSKITEYVRATFASLRTHGFADAMQTALTGPPPDAAGANNEEESAGYNAEEAVDEETAGRAKRARTDPDTAATASATVLAARQSALKALREVDNVHMTCASFFDWSESEECRGLKGTVALILTDPPYNTRRASRAVNSGHDQLSATEMTQVADLIADLLRPSGQAYVFCSFVQWNAWRTALLDSGGGDVLAVSSTPELIIRHPSCVRSMGQYMYHRVNTAEVAVHAYKRVHATRTGAPSFEELTAAGMHYGDMVGFGNPNLSLLSPSSMPVFAAAIDGYKPPTGVELLKANGAVIRPEQKSVKLLRDIIRLFAPKPTDVVVDLFAGTMSTAVAALLEGRPVHVCEVDQACFNAAEARVHDLQYRRGANNLISRLTAAESASLRSTIPPESDAVDTLDEEINYAEG